MAKAKAKATPKAQPKPAAHRPLVMYSNSPDEAQGTAMGRFATRPDVQSSLTIQAYGKKIGDLELQGLAEALTDEVKKVNDGDLQKAEAMLITQAHALDGMFNCLAARGAANMGEYLDSADKYIRLALKAQAQCARTLEVLAAIKNPPTVFARQANITSGPQQINNGVAQVEKPKAAQNELLEADNGERLDATAQAKAIGADPHLETVGASNRAKNARG